MKSKSVVAIGKQFLYKQAAITNLSLAYRLAFFFPHLEFFATKSKEKKDKRIYFTFLSPFNFSSSEGSDMMVNNLAMSDGQEGLDAFKEKRKPIWSHKLS